jgi:hypothetical protein
MDKHVEAIDLVTLASELIVPRAPVSFFSKPSKEWIAAAPHDGELYLKQYTITDMWEKGRIAVELRNDIVSDFELSKGIFEEDVTVLEQHAGDIVNSVLSKIGSNDGCWYLYLVATDANDVSSMIYIVMEFDTSNAVIITKLRACGGHNSRVLYARTQLLNPAYEVHMSKTIH